MEARRIRGIVLCRYLLSVLALALLPSVPVEGHDVSDHPTIVIDTDMGLDDAVTLAMALQAPEVEIVGIVACEGASGGQKCVERLESLLSLFNRRDIPLYAPAETNVTQPSPPFRPFAEGALGKALPDKAAPFHRSFAPDAYVRKGKKTVILALGPFTNLAVALNTKPEIKQGIEEVIFAGSPEGVSSWNVRWNPDALAVVRASGLPLEFVVGGQAGRKPDAWRQGPLMIGQGTSIGEGFVKRLLANPQVRSHYLERFECFHDELAFLYYMDSTPFSPTADRAVFAPRLHKGVLGLFTRLISHGRQYRTRVVFAQGVFPDDVLQEDIKEHKARMIAKNGEEEWFAQLLMNELHEHLGAYSVVGVKMGLRAAELLNAPPHGTKVLSHTAAGPPVSCLNDGVIVATGATPGRQLFAHEPGPPGSTEVAFSFNERHLTMVLKPEYQDKIGHAVRTLREKYTLADHAYWEGVRRFGLEIWEKWHRRDLFVIVETAGVPKVPGVE